MGKREKLQTKAATATDAPYKGSMQRFQLKLNNKIIFGLIIFGLLYKCSYLYFMCLN